MPKIAVLNQVSKTFDNGVEAVQSLSLDIAVGERLSLLGPSGCGKTTVLRMLAGLETPSGGDISINRDDADQIGFVFQSPTLLPWKTVFENVWSPLQLRGVSKAEAQSEIEDLLERVYLADFKDAYPRELSGGMQMRVSIARALVMKPKLLLMDEPFAALDEMTRFKLNDLLLEQQKREQFALLFVTHSVFESAYLCDRVAIMTNRPGRLHRIVDTSSKEVRDETYRTSRAYIDICREISGHLQEAV
jgi:NitT/TauT family transport system ATP-binding protein